MEIYFILVEPAVPENVGAAARAMKTMGFSKMRVVNTVAHRSEQAYWLAHGAADILDQAACYDTFGEAVRDLDFTIGTTSKRRSVKHDYHTPERVVGMISAKADALGRVGIVFGSEESGLSNTSLEDCDIASTIPLAQSFPSLNLGQSVMLYAYVFSMHKHLDQGAGHIAASGLYPRLKHRVSTLLARTGLPEERNLHGRILERLAMCGEGDIHLLLSVCDRIESALDDGTTHGS